MSGFKYDDILNMKYPNPGIEKDFPDKVLREAQFAPFAALTGYGDAIAETSRQTEKRSELDEYEVERLNNKLRYLSDSDEPTRVTVTYYVPDKKKDGGAYVSKSGTVKKIREFERDIVMDDGEKIPIDNIYSISGVLDDEFGI